MKKFLSWKLGAILVAALVLGFFDLPGSVQKTIIPFTPDAITETSINLGLDLQGGSQLDYKVDLRKVPEADQESIVEGVKGVIEKRVNSLGVSEPNIYISEIGGETHIIVELAETATVTQEDVENYLDADKKVANLTEDEKKIVSLEKAKATVGKTIQLEFKEQKSSLDPQEREKIHNNAQIALDRINNGEDFSIVGQEEMQAYPGKVNYEKAEYQFEEDIAPQTIKDIVLAKAPGEHTTELVETGGSFVMDGLTGELVEDTSISIIKVLDKKEEVKNEKEVYVSHVLVQWAGTEHADASIVRTEDEAYDLIKEVQKKLKDGGEFTTIAKEYSEDPSTKETGGKYDEPVVEESTYPYDFEKAALGLEPGELSDIVKTQNGYHIIKVDQIRENVKYPKYQYEVIQFSTKPDPWQETGLTGEHFVRADVMTDNLFQPYISIQFNDEGARLFEELTEKNVGKPIAIFVGGEFISAPNVNEKIAGGQARITSNFTPEEAQVYARDLNTGAIPAPIVLTGEYTIGATLGHEALTKSLTAGAIGLILIMIFMLAFYRLSGLVANAALTVYAIILIFLIKSQLPLGLALMISIGIFFYLIAKIVNNKDSGWEKSVSLFLSIIAFFFLTFLLKTGVVLTLAGVAGIILSIGMAVDANILIFERFKEELRSGKTFGAAVDAGFNRAWSAIRDSNFSTLITCAILFYLGSSIIKGFAFNLAAGVVVSMFTAITITRTLLRGFVGKRIAENIKAFGECPERKVRKIDFVGKSKLWLGISGTFVGISILSIIFFGLNLGIDFKGGTLLEFQFSEPITKEALAENLIDIENQIKSGDLEDIAEEESAVVVEEESETSEETEVATPPSESKIPEVALIAEENTPEEILDLTNIQILSSGENGFIVKTKYITSETHDQMIAKMKEVFPSFTEPRFTTIGPVLGKTMLSKAVTAIIFALMMIVIYVAIAFRKIPKEVSPWRFGVAAIAALLHDVIIVTGIFAALSHFMGVEVDTLFVTAMLTVFGYSVNDTIVIFDRLRENLLHQEKEESIDELANKALNQTLTRSINTSFSTLLALLSVLFLGSGSIFFFILALTLGTVFG
ncbi:protein translocase subunit SecF, partial [Candidatus Peregrinibacteria bacterium]|nr:protein translocase subunit SecF [Candidatus Peregrinibacteria bacterium]